DGQGNYTLGISDHSIFPEVNADGTNANMGMDICINTSATNDEEGRELLAQFGMPFRKSTSETVEKTETAEPAN
ncbi:MAG: large subunit ribosomal protein L5, partial [Lentimonas sp.]